jgi:hypothetical protein
VRWSLAEGGGVATSFSGYERNHLFLNLEGKRFQDVSGVSGLDSIADSRSFALLDYDRDGWQDIAMVNTNAPFFELFHNEIGARRASVASASKVRDGEMIAVRFVGGNRTAVGSDYSNRDGYGASVSVGLGAGRIVREHRCGEGFGTQNSATMSIGIGDREGADFVSVRWPSGKVQRVGDVEAGSLLTFYEDPSQAPDGSGSRREPYRLPAKARIPVVRSTDRMLIGPSVATAPAKLRLHTTTATWCDACKKSLRQLGAIRAAFAETELLMLGVPVDEEDTSEKLAAYVAEYEPAYRMLPDLPESTVSAVVSRVIAALNDEVLPASIITDAQGKVLQTMAGVPSISALRKWMANASPIEQ